MRIPDLRELEPEELKYLRRVCALLHKLDAWQEHRMGREGEVCTEEDYADFEPFDPDELGIDPEDEDD